MPGGPSPPPPPPPQAAFASPHPLATPSTSPHTTERNSTFLYRCVLPFRAPVPTSTILYSTTLYSLASTTLYSLTHSLLLGEPIDEEERGADGDDGGEDDCVFALLALDGGYHVVDHRGVGEV